MADETSNTVVEQQKEESTPAPEVPKEVEKPVENGESTEAKATEEETQPEDAKTDGQATGTEGADDKQNETAAENPLEAPKENPFSEEDFEKLLSYTDANEEGWEKLKNKHKGLTIYKRSDKAEKNGMPLIKGVFDLPTVSFDRAVELFTDLDERRKWNKKMISEVLETRDDFRILYTTIKLPPPYTNRDLVQCAAVKITEDPKQNAYVFKQCNHPNKPPTKSTITRAELQYGGLLVKPGEDENSSQVIVVNQINMKGWIPKPILHKMNNSYPSVLYDDLSTFMKKAAAAADKEQQAEAAAAAPAADNDKDEGDKAKQKDSDKKDDESEKAEDNKGDAEQKGEKDEEKTEEIPKAENNEDAEGNKEKTEDQEATEAS